MSIMIPIQCLDHIVRTGLVDANKDTSIYQLIFANPSMYVETKTRDR